MVMLWMGAGVATAFFGLLWTLRKSAVVLREPEQS